MQGVRAVVEWARHGANTTVFHSSSVLCIAWAVAAIRRSGDHWQQAAKPPTLDADGLPARRKLWWALWPFFNLSFMTALAAVGHDDKTHDGFMSVVADDRLWNLAALAVTLALVSYSALRGARVTLCSRKPNAEFTAGFLSAALFSWFSPIIDVGQAKQLDLDDLPVQACHHQCRWGTVEYSCVCIYMYPRRKFKFCACMHQTRSRPSFHFFVSFRCSGPASLRSTRILPKRKCKNEGATTLLFSALEYAGFPRVRYCRPSSCCTTLVCRRAYISVLLVRFPARDVN